MLNIDEITFMDFLQKQDNVPLELIMKQIPKDSHAGRMICGLVQEYLDQHHLAIVEYQKALELKSDLFILLSIARVHAKISHW